MLSFSKIRLRYDLQTYLTRFNSKQLCEGVFAAAYGFDNDAPAPVKAYPMNPEEGMTFQIIGNLVAESPELKLFEKRPKTYVFGQPDHRQNFHLTHEFMFVQVRFQPGALFQLSGIPMNELVHQGVDAALIFGQDIDEVDDRLANAPDYASIPSIWDAFFLKRILGLKHHNQIRPAT